MKNVNKTGIPDSVKLSLLKKNPSYFSNGIRLKKLKKYDFYFVGLDVINSEFLVGWSLQ